MLLQTTFLLRVTMKLGKKNFFSHFCHFVTVNAVSTPFASEMCAHQPPPSARMHITLVIIPLQFFLVIFFSSQRVLESVVVSAGAEASERMGGK